MILPESEHSSSPMLLLGLSHLISPTIISTASRLVTWSSSLPSARYTATRSSHPFAQTPPMSSNFYWRKSLRSDHGPRAFRDLDAFPCPSELSSSALCTCCCLCWEHSSPGIHMATSPLQVLALVSPLCLLPWLLYLKSNLNSLAPFTFQQTPSTCHVLSLEDKLHESRDCVICSLR